jgi:hypothetical protein
MKTIKKHVSILLAFITFSCSVNVYDVTSIEKENEKDCQLDIYRDVNNIKRKYKIVCTIDSKTSYSMFQSHTGAEAIKMAGFRACKFGADGMIVVSSGRSSFNWFLGRRGVAKLKAIAYIE